MMNGIKDKSKKGLILASGSPRRREILEMAGYRFSVVCPDADEAVGGMEPKALAAENAKRKAAAALEICEGVIICADTVVLVGEKLLGKPHGEGEAFEMLSLLSGKAHTVVTGWCVTDGETTVSRTTETKVTVRELLPEEIRAYIATGSPLDKAGAYGIQDAGAMFISSIEGDYYTVMGLPLCEISQVLRDKFGIVPFNK